MGSNSRRGLGPVALLCLALVATGVHGASVDSRPNIIFIMADDHGYHDVGYHNSRIRTPTLDRLAAEGVTLENYYVQPVCSPTRLQFLSGRYQTHTGMQHGYIRTTQPKGLPLDNPTVANVLKDAGYSTHMVGKWHVGFFKKEYLPNNRGFDTFYGLLTGSSGHFSHKNGGYLDLRDNLKPDRNQTGRYSTHLFTDKAIETITNHKASGSQVPPEYLEEYKDIRDTKRRKYAGMVTCMDEGIGNLTAVLRETGLMDNTVIVYSTDNGGQHSVGGNNYPLRGSKGSLFEGGIRGLGFVHSPLLKQKGYVNNNLMHVSDWFPTFVNLARGSLNSTLPLDGVDQWKTISEDAPAARTELLHNIDPLRERVGKSLYPDIFDTRVRAAVRVGDYKLITGYPSSGNWKLPPEWNGRDPGMKQKRPERGVENVRNNTKVRRDKKVKKGKKVNTDKKVSRGKINKGKKINRNKKTKPQNIATVKNLRLFNVAEDPEERHDLSDSMPEKVRELLHRLKFYNSTAVPVVFPPMERKASPWFHGGVWGPWK